MKPSNNMKNKIPSDTYWRVELVCTKVWTHSSLEPQLQYNHDQIPLRYQDLLWPFLTILGVTEILCSFRLILGEKTCKEIPESSKSEFFEKFSANNFALLDAEDKTSWPLNWVVIYSRFTFVEKITGISSEFTRAKFQTC